MIVVTGVKQQDLKISARMDEKGKNSSVFELVTQLCEKTLEVNDVPVRNNVVKKLRSKAYSILLNKVAPQDTPANWCVPETKDPYSELIAWQYILSTEHNFREHSERIDTCVDTLKKSMDGEVLKSVLSLLVQLKELPKKDTSLWSSNVESGNTNCFFKVFDAKSFEMPNPFICANAKYSDESFHFPKKSKKKIHSKGSKHQLSKMRSCRNYKNREEDFNLDKFDEGYESIDISYEIWDDIICKAEYTNYRTWETLGDPTPEKELPFAIESSPETSSLLYDIQEISVHSLNKVHHLTRIIDEKEFIRDTKNVMVGVTSKTFIKDENDRIIMKPGISVKGVTSSMLRIYSKDAIFCGACYKALNDMIAVDPFTGSRKQKGFIFAEFCNSIKKYLLYYRVAATALPDSAGLLKHSSRIKKLLKQLHILSSVCKVGPFHESEHIPDGVALLNYLYDKVLGLSNKDVSMVLYSILYPCLQVYFNRFLRQWILEGTVKDPHWEFFIKPDNKFLRSRGRTFWSRSFKICEGIVPQFLSHLSTEILNCGKTMCLLKLCAPSSATYKYLTGTKPNILQCCFSSEQLSRLENNVRCYYLEVIAESGPRLCMENLITQSREDEQIFLTMIAVKRATTLKKIEAEKLKTIKAVMQKKLEDIKALKEQYDMAVQQKEMSRLAELEQEMNEHENLLKMKKLEEKIIQEEAADMIKYYENLFEESERRSQSINKHMETIKSIQLDDKTEEQNKSEQTKTNDNQQPLDLINANTEISNFEQALLNKRRVLSSELGFESDNGKSMTDAQKNKLKVMHTEIGIDAQKGKPLTEAQKNKLKVMTEEMGIDVKKEARNENLTEVQKNRLKVMNVAPEVDPERKKTDVGLTEAQKNKLKVMTEEMGIAVEKTSAHDKPLTDAQKNRLKIMNVAPEKDPESKKADVVLTDAQKNRLKVMNVDSSELERKPSIPVLTEAMLEAKRNKNKVMNVEMGDEVKDVVTTGELTEAQRNKKKVMSSEFGIAPELTKRNLNRQLSNMEINRNKNMASNECFTYEVVTRDDVNDNFIANNKNEMLISTRSDELNDNYIIPPIYESTKRYANLKLDFKKLKKTHEENINKTNFQSASVFEKFMKSPHFEFSRPMSVDSTPMTEFSPLPSLPDRFSNLDTVSTACSNFTDEGFQFPQEKTPAFRNPTDPTSINHITKAEVDNISINCLNHFVQQSIAIPIMAQTDLLQHDLLKYIIKDLKIIDHLISLRNYFFLLDGEFGRNITEALFEKLYEVDSPKDLINNNTLNHLVYDAVEFSSKYNENSKYLSFKIVSLPKEFELMSNQVLDCLSLTYKMQWPLNIIVPSDSISKYDEVFKFILKLHRVSWILKKIFMELKLLAKRCGKQEAYLMLSPHYQKVQHYRHIMTHFVNTFQAYIVGEVLQNSWASFEENLSFVTNLDQLHYIHMAYLRNILFLCLLNQRSMPVRKVINSIFELIIKFDNNLRTRQWEFDENQFVHPCFHRLEDIFANFLEFVRFLFRTGRKFARVGYQPELAQFVDMLDVNDYYSKKVAASAPRN